MVAYEYRIYGSSVQLAGIAASILAAQFIRNKCLDAWLENYKLPAEKRRVFSKYSFNYMLPSLVKEFDFVRKLSSTARQAAAERCSSAVTRFYTRVKDRAAGRLGSRKVGYPRFRHDARSVEYKHAGWKLSADFRQLKLSDGHKIGWLRLAGGRWLTAEAAKHIKRLQVVRKADGYYAQFILDVDTKELVERTGTGVGIDLGVDVPVMLSTGQALYMPKSIDKQRAKLDKYKRRMTRQVLGSNNRGKTRKKFAKANLKVTRQRIDFAMKTARYVVRSNDLIVMEDLKVMNMTKTARGTRANPGKSTKAKGAFNRAVLNVSWRRLRHYVEYYAKKFSRTFVAVAPQYTSQRCSKCGHVHAENRKTRAQFVCLACGFASHADHNAALNILDAGNTSVNKEKTRRGTPGLPVESR